MDNVNVLEHHGIKGMKWGRRRYQNPDGSLTPAGRARYGQENKSSEAAEVETLRRTKTMSEMTNSELQRVVTRMNLERQYNQLTAQERAANKSRLDRIMGGVSKATDVANKAQAAYSAYKNIKGIYNSPEFAVLRERLSRKKGK